jgi:hypothetical protein
MQYMRTDATSDTRNYDLEGHVGEKVSVSERFVNIARGFVYVTSYTAEIGRISTGRPVDYLRRGIFPAGGVSVIPIP